MAEYQIVDKKDRRKLAQFLAGEGEVLLPLLALIETAELGPAPLGSWILLYDGGHGDG